MRAMGLSRLVLVCPRAFPHPEADARAADATELLRAAMVVPTLEDALAGATLAIGFSARPREFAGAVLSVRDAAFEALGHAVSGEVALVFGAEMSGLSNAELARCQIVATIPGERGHASLNLAAAVQVAAYELFVAAHGDTVWNAPAFEPAKLEEIEGDQCALTLGKKALDLLVGGGLERGRCPNLVAACADVQLVCCDLHRRR